jgi:hypothetical protein
MLLLSDHGMLMVHFVGLPPDSRSADRARIFFSHDPEFWRSVPQAPAAIR